MAQNKNKLIDQLADALNVLDDFEKFLVNVLNGKYSSLPVLQTRPDEDFQSLVAELDKTKLVLLQHVIHTASELNAIE